MPKIPDCVGKARRRHRCQLYAHSPHLICAVHADGVEGKTCPDFRPRPGMETEELWSPTGYCWYGGELIKSHTPRLTREQQLEILDTHPFFTHKCPECGYHFDRNNPPPVHWDCPDCGWVDDSV